MGNLCKENVNTLCYDSFPIVCGGGGGGDVERLLVCVKVYIVSSAKRQL